MNDPDQQTWVDLMFSVLFPRIYNACQRLISALIDGLIMPYQSYNIFTSINFKYICLIKKLKHDCFHISLVNIIASR